MSANSPGDISTPSSAKAARIAPDEGGAKFGTFGGVFTPCTLTILGVIMFLRYGNVVGNAGLIWAIVILAVSKVITVLTTLSLSAAATNTRVEGGGAFGFDVRDRFYRGIHGVITRGR